MRIAIQDANILIDLINCGLLNHCLSLQFDFASTDIILSELYENQLDDIQPHIIAGRFTVINISAEELINIQDLTATDSRLSEQDWSAIFFAENKKGILLSGDKHVREISRRRNLPVFGILWVIDQLVDNNVLTANEACTTLKQLMQTNKRLPVTDCEERIKLWCQ